MSLTDEAIRAAVERGYRVSDSGEVSGTNGPVKPRLKGRTAKYWHISINYAGQSRPVPVHRLAAYQRFGETALAPGIHVRHGVGGPQDNSVSNLTLGTASQNELDKPRETRIRVARQAIAKRWGNPDPYAEPTSHPTPRDQPQPVGSLSSSKEAHHAASRGKAPAVFPEAAQ